MLFVRVLEMTYFMRARTLWPTYVVNYAHIPKVVVAASEGVGMNTYDYIHNQESTGAHSNYAMFLARFPC